MEETYTGQLMQEKHTCLAVSSNLRVCAVGFKHLNYNMETQGELYPAQDDVMHISPRCEVIKKRALVEVFSVQIIIKPSDQLELIRGVILLKGSDQNYVIYEDPCDERGPQFDSEGQLILSGPECGVEVKDIIVIYTWLFDRYLSSCDRSKGNIVWKRDACCPRLDQFIRKGFKIGTRLMQVDFAVYGDGVEAHIEVFLSDLKVDEGLLQSGKAVEVYGIIKATNSTLVHPEANSVLFNHMTSRECIKVSNWPPDEAEIRIPLTRNVLVIPRESALVVDVRLLFSCALQNSPIAVGSAVFDARLRSNCNIEDQIIHGGHAKVIVRVTWSI